jgi:hypothetical protein
LIVTITHAEIPAMIKRVAIVLCLSVPTSIHPAVFAAQEKHTFEVSVDIPTLGFYVLPSEADWIHREQTLPWDIHTSTLLGLRKSFDVKTDGSAIEARLESFPYLTAGGDSRDNIVLRVSFNGKELAQDPAPRQVVCNWRSCLASRPVATSRASTTARSISCSTWRRRQDEQRMPNKDNRPDRQGNSQWFQLCASA